MARFTIVIPHVPGYPHTEAFREVAEAVMYGLRSLGHAAVIDRAPRLDSRAIVMGVHCLAPAEVLELPPGTIVYNLEPESSFLFDATLQRTAPGTVVWDYDPANVATWRAIARNATHVPIGYAPELARLHLVDDPTIDVLFYGSLNDRRTRVLEELRDRGLRIQTLFGVYGEERDRLIEQARLVLNVHYRDGAPLEEPRLAYLLTNRVAVLTEGPVSGRHKVLTYPYELLVDACVDWSSHPEELRLWADVGHRGFSEVLESEILAAALSL